MTARAAQTRGVRMTEELAALAAQQAGVVSRAQALAAGVTRSAIGHAL
ncbi:MAG: hypothetical protein QOF57_1100, partial [Frankiaceae bacterium]|nr:hypothetical protein [Frankiaceae bacterium]